MHKKVAHAFRLLLTGTAITTAALAGGCGGSEETSAKSDPVADKTRLDGMREGMMKSKAGINGMANKPK
jgi:hypothetical protein